MVSNQERVIMTCVGYIGFFSHISKVRSNFYKSLEDQCQKLSIVIDKLHFWKTKPNIISILFFFLRLQSTFQLLQKPGRLPIAIWPYVVVKNACKFNKQDLHLRFLDMYIQGSRLKKLPSLQVT